MRAILKSSIIPWIAILCAQVGSVALAAGPLDRSQTIDLKKGWNAVHLTVEPVETAIE